LKGRQDATGEGRGSGRERGENGEDMEVREMRMHEKITQIRHLGTTI